MPMRWRGRPGGTAILVAATLLAGCGSASGRSADAARLTVADDAGRELATLSLPKDGGFALEYRNSLYGTMVRESFRASRDVISLEALWAEQLAVLEEYYAIDEPADRELGGWTAAPAIETRLTELRLAATDLGERTLLVEGADPIPLYRFVEDETPTVLITVDGG